MNKDLVEFNKFITELKGNKQIMRYEDEEGNYLLIPISNLFCSVEYLELDKAEYDKAAFNKIIDKSLNYKTGLSKRIVDKSQMTGNKKDQGTLIDKTVNVKMVWVAKNGLGCKSSFTNKEDALKVAKELNDTYLKIAELI